MIDRRKFIQGVAAALIAPSLPVSTPGVVPLVIKEFIPTHKPERADWYGYQEVGVGILDNRRMFKGDI